MPVPELMLLVMNINIALSAMIGFLPCFSSRKGMDLSSYLSVAKLNMVRFVNQTLMILIYN